MNSILKNNLPHLVALAVFLLISVAYFSPQLQGKVDQSADITSYESNAQEIKDFKKETGDNTLWTNSLFGGMPAYQISADHNGNKMRILDKLTHLYIPRPIGLFFAAMLIFYVMLILLGVNPWIGMIGAIAFGLSTGNYILYAAGHINKIKAIVNLGLIAGGVILAFRKQYLQGGLVFAVGLGLSLYANHIQMTYYFFITLVILGILEFIQHAKNNELPSFGKAVAYLALGGILAVGATTSKLWTTYEYGKYTMRGAPILEKEANVQSTSSNMDGLEYGYATKWSNGFIDMVATFIPKVAGDRGLTYWGGIVEGTAGPTYMGAIICFLFLLGALLVRGTVKWWLVIGVLLIGMLSMGKNNFIHKIFFDYVPLFNKFRTPNSTLSVASFMIPLLGILGFHQVFFGNHDQKKLLRSLYIAGGTFLGICLFFAVLGGSMFDLNAVNDAAYASQYKVDVNKLLSERASMISSDAWRSFGLILVAAAILWFAIKEKIDKKIVFAAFALLITFDLWDINKDYMNEANFVSKTAAKRAHAARPVDTQILQDTDPNYRIFDISKGLSNAVNSAAPSYFHKNIGGYHPAKLQRYQDLLDRHILREAGGINGQSLEAIQGQLAGTNVLNMLNMKYLIVNDKAAVPNPHALGNSWFVNDYQMVETANEEIDKIRSINPKQTAVVHKEFENVLAGLAINRNGSIKQTSYAPNKMVYASNSTSDQLAVFSEVWYGPNVGWEASIDGNLVEAIRVNYGLRGLRIPAGSHNIEFNFRPKSYYTGEIISLICSLAIILGLLGYLYFWIQKKRKEMPAKVVAKEKPVATVSKVGKPKKKGKKKKK